MIGVWSRLGCWGIMATTVWPSTSASTRMPRAEARQLARTCFRLAQGTAWLGRHGADPVVRERRALWRGRRGWVPWRSIWGLDRIQARGGATSARERARLRAAQFACVQVPLTLGGLVGSLRERPRPWIPRKSA